MCMTRVVSLNNGNIRNYYVRPIVPRAILAASLFFFTILQEQCPMSSKLFHGAVSREESEHEKNVTTRGQK